MIFGLKKKFLAIVAAIAIVAGVCPAYAKDTVQEEVTIVVQDITESTEALPILEGEAKVKVSAKGITSTANIAQLTFNLRGDMKYKAIQYLIDDNGVDSSLQAICKGNVLSTSAVYVEPVINLKADSFTDICIITFSGDAGDSIKLSLDTDDSYFAVDYPSIPDEYAVQMSSSDTAYASESGSKGVDAKVILEMNKVTSFELDSNNLGIDISIIGEDPDHPVIFTTEVKENTGSIVPTLLVETLLAEGQTYTVRVSGPGYIPYEKTGVNFQRELKITNADFVPGELVEDGVIDSKDKTEFDKIRNSGKYNLVADFNRDGSVTSSDAIVYSGIEDESNGKDNGNNGNNNDGGAGGGGGGAAPDDKKDTESGETPKEDAPSTGTGTAKFFDLGNYSWAESYIYKLQEKGIVSGTSENTYSPANNIRRGDFILMLTKMLGIPETNGDNFADVPAGSYYAGAIAAAKASGIASGDGGNFRPNENITRQDLMALAYRAFLAAGYISEAEDFEALEAFSDKDMISEYARAPMAALVKAGIIQGSDGQLNPKGNATRAEVAVMCARLLDLME